MLIIQITWWNIIIFSAHNYWRHKVLYAVKVFNIDYDFLEFILESKIRIWPRIVDYSIILKLISNVFKLIDLREFILDVTIMCMSDESFQENTDLHFSCPYKPYSCQE